MGWKGKARHSRDRERKRQGPVDGGPYLALIGSTNLFQDRCTVKHLSVREVRVAHPYIGPNSWIRVGPEGGTGVLMSSRWDEESHEIIRYYQKYPEKGIEAYEEGQSYMKPLKEGEFDLTSLGLAQITMGNRGRLTLRGGPVWQTLDADFLSINSRSPLFNRQLANRVHSELGDEERFGSVMRPGLIVSASPRFLTTGPVPLKEYYRSLKSDSVPGNLLTEIHEGDCVDDNGLPRTSNLTGLKVRYSRDLYTDTGGSTSVVVDTSGNTQLSMAQTATTGLDVRSPSSITVSAQRLLEAKSNADLSIESLTSLNISTNGTMEIKTTGLTAATRLKIDNTSWNHGHLTPTGLTGGPQSLAP